jgi:hypothetical protein
MSTYKVDMNNKYVVTFSRKNNKPCDYIQVYLSNQKVKEIQFRASKSLLNKYETELKQLGFINVGNSNPGTLLHKWENKTKKLGAQIVGIDKICAGMLAFNIYRTDIAPEPIIKDVTYFEKFIISGTTPPDTNVQTKYETDYRVIVWNEPLIKSYKYSNEAFDKLGYELVKKNEGDNQQTSNVYRCCSKGIVIEVTEWYNFKLSIAIQWYAPSMRRQIGYLMYCN